MSNLSNIIEDFIKELMEANNYKTIEIQRNILAHQFDCAPSQINYVLTTRFNNDRGYIVESRRGGGGCIKIFRVRTSMKDEIQSLLNDSIGSSITFNKALDLINALLERKIISLREQQIMQSSLSERALNAVAYEERNKIRADILKEMVLSSVEKE